MSFLRLISKAIICVLFFVIVVSTHAQSTPQYAVCDACGFCKNTVTDSSDPYAIKDEYIVPSNWEDCRKCLYSASTNTGNPQSKETLLIDPSSGRAPTPQPGRYYTMLGCVNSNLDSFRQTGSASSLVQVIMNLLFGTVGGIAFLYILYGSFIVLTSRSDAERLNYGKRILMGAMVGLAISLGAIFILNLIANDVLKLPGFSRP